MLAISFFIKNFNFTSQVNKSNNDYYDFWSFCLLNTPAHLYFDSLKSGKSAW